MTHFKLLQPRTLDEALAALAEEDAVPLAGGTDLLLRVREGKRHPARVVSLTGIKSLSGIRVDGRSIRVGALTRMHEIEMSEALRERVPVLPYAASLVGSWQVRNLATIGGNLANAAPSADTATPLLVLGARLKINSLAGEREINASCLFEGPGRTCLAPGEILTEVRFDLPGGAWGASYIKFSPRRAMDIATVGVAALVRRDGARVAAAGIGLAAVAPVPMRAPCAEDALAGRLGGPDLWCEAGEIASGLCSPREGGRAGTDYRRYLVEVLTARALGQAWDASQDDKGSRE